MKATALFTSVSLIAASASGAEGTDKRYSMTVETDIGEQILGLSGSFQNQAHCEALARLVYNPNIDPDGLLVTMDDLLMQYAIDHLGLSQETEKITGIKCELEQHNP